MSDQNLGSDSYECHECGLHYCDKEMANKCEAYCKKHKACSMEIAAHAVENEGGVTHES